MTEAISIPAEREGKAAQPDQAERRAQMAGAVQAGMVATRRPVKEGEIAGVRTLRVSPANGAPKGYFLMFHGGGYRIGMPEFNGPFAERLADRCSLEVILPAYRLSPENPFPAGINDGLAVLKALVAEIGDAPLLVGGDSAGGGLAAGLAVYAAANGIAKFDGAILLSPWLDLTITAGAYDENYTVDPLFNKDAANAASQLYLQGFDPRHPLASPLFADLAAFPPTFINVGTGESLRDDTTAFHEKLEAAGVSSRMLVIPDMEHTAVVRNPELTGAAESFEALADFVNGVLGAA